MNSFWKHLDEVFEKFAPEFWHTLAPPATHADLESVEDEIGYRLHDDVREAYLRHDGVVHVSPAYDLFYIMGIWSPLSVALRNWRERKCEIDQLRIDSPEYFARRDETWDYFEIQEVPWDEGRFPIGWTGTALGIYVDMVPAGMGHAGQIIQDDFSSEPTVLAVRLNNLLQTIADHLEAGTVVFDVVDGFLVAATGKRVSRYLPELI